MIRENVVVSGSLDVSGQFIIPNGTKDLPHLRRVLCF